MPSNTSRADGIKRGNDGGRLRRQPPPPPRSGPIVARSDPSAGSPTSSQSYRSCSSPPKTCDRAPSSLSEQKVSFRFHPLPAFLRSGSGLRNGRALGPVYLGCPYRGQDQIRPFPVHRVAHSITSSARARSVGGMVRPRARAAFRLTISSNLVACWIGPSGCPGPSGCEENATSGGATLHDPEGQSLSPTLGPGQIRSSADLMPSLAALPTRRFPSCARETARRQRSAGSAWRPHHCEAASPTSFSCRVLGSPPWYRVGPWPAILGWTRYLYSSIRSSRSSSVASLPLPRSTPAESRP